MISLSEPILSPQMFHRVRVHSIEGHTNRNKRIFECTFPVHALCVSLIRGDKRGKTGATSLPPVRSFAFPRQRVCCLIGSANFVSAFVKRLLILCLSSNP